MPRVGQQGFTLVELSIVLVIIGLILGGVMVGRSMIRSSQVNSVAQDFQAYEAAAQMFIDKYDGIPGDITNATTFWGAAVANGNGNGQLDNASVAGAAGEIFGAWEQMALAGLIKGKFTGISGSGSPYDSDISVNVPAARVTGGGYSFYYRGTQSGSAFAYDGYYGNTLYVGLPENNSIMQIPILTPAEAYQIDLKIDDGVPGVGTVRTHHPGWAPGANCTTGGAAAAATSSYNAATYTGVACTLMLVLGF